MFLTFLLHLVFLFFSFFTYASKLFIQQSSIVVIMQTNHREGTKSIHLEPNEVTVGTHRAGRVIWHQDDTCWIHWWSLIVIEAFLWAVKQCFGWIQWFTRTVTIELQANWCEDRWQMRQSGLHYSSKHMKRNKNEIISEVLSSFIIFYLANTHTIVEKSV